MSERVRLDEEHDAERCPECGRIWPSAMAAAYCCAERP